MRKILVLFLLGTWSQLFVRFRREYPPSRVTATKQKNYSCLLGWVVQLIEILYLVKALLLSAFKDIVEHFKHNVR